MKFKFDNTFKAAGSNGAAVHRLQLWGEGLGCSTNDIWLPQGQEEFPSLAVSPWSWQTP